MVIFDYTNEKNEVLTFRIKDAKELIIVDNFIRFNTGYSMVHISFLDNEHAKEAMNDISNYKSHVSFIMPAIKERYDKNNKFGEKSIDEIIDEDNIKEAKRVTEEKELFEKTQKEKIVLKKAYDKEKEVEKEEVVKEVKKRSKKHKK